MATTIFTTPKTVQIENPITHAISDEVITIQEGLSSAAIKQAIYLEYGTDGT